jgi:hypothetical protein
LGGKAQTLGGGARHVEFALAPIGTGVIHAHDGGVAVRWVAHEQDGAVGIDGAGGAVGFVGPERFARRRQSARIEAVATAVIVMGRFEHGIAADDCDHFGYAENPMADAVKAIGLARRFGFD